MCDQCETLNTALAFVPNMIGALSKDSPILFDEQDPYTEVMWLPEMALGKHFPDVPQHIASAANEAYRCQQIGAHRGAIALARAVVEATAKEKGVIKGTLNAKIDELAAAGLLRQHTADVAHEVRHLGNEVAHGDFVEPTSSEEASEALDLMAEVLDEVFVSRARLDRVREGRAARAAKQKEAK